MIILTRRQRRTLDAITTEWQTTNVLPSDPIIQQLEKRGLIETRVNPELTALQATQAELWGDRNHWQVRRVS